ncbi:MAG: DUF1566 domain-containing protein [Bacteroidota bacterium]
MKKHNLIIGILAITSFLLSPEIINGQGKTDGLNERGEKVEATTERILRVLDEIKATLKTEIQNSDRVHEGIQKQIVRVIGQIKDGLTAEKKIVDRGYGATQKQVLKVLVGVKNELSTEVENGERDLGAIQKRILKVLKGVKDELGFGIKIGDKAHGGIVFYIDHTGEHGLVCAEEDLGLSDRGWFSASRVVDSYTEGGFSNWRLPSLEELHLMYEHLHEKGLGGFVDHLYWSSTEVSFHGAWVLDFENGRELGVNKNIGYNARVVRAF